MKNRFARQLRNAADACIRNHFVYDHRVCYICLDTYLTSDFASYKTSKVACMLHTSIYQVVRHVVVDLVDTAFDRFAYATSAYDGIDAFDVDVMLGKSLFYKVFAPLKLVRDCGKACEILGLVPQRCCQYRLIVIVYGDFC